MPNDLLGTTIPTGSLMVPSGAPGPQGLPSWSQVTEDFAVPEIGDSVEVTLEVSTWATIGAVLFIGGMYGRVTAIDENTVTLERLADGGFEGGGAGVIVSDDPPDNPRDGALWFGDGTLHVWDGSEWLALGGGGATIEVADEAPSEREQGMLWWDTVSAKLFLWDGEQWIIVVNTPSTEDLLTEIEAIKARLAALEGP